MCNLKYKYLIVECEEMDYPIGCDADRKMICVTNNYQPFKKFGYEVYKIEEDGMLNLIQEYDQYSQHH